MFDTFMRFLMISLRSAVPAFCVALPSSNAALDLRFPPPPFFPMLYIDSKITVVVKQEREKADLAWTWDVRCDRSIAKLEATSHHL